jgi:hypothetical protein
MAVSQIAVTEGSGKNIATHEISETTTKQIQRVAINTAAGVDISPLSESDFDTKVGSLTETAPATDTASSGLNGCLQRIAQRLTSLIALLPASIGQKAKAAALAVTLASDEDLLTNIGGVTETAPATDTTSSGLNGRLQRIAQRITSLIALVPTSLLSPPSLCHCHRARQPKQHLLRGSPRATSTPKQVLLPRRHPRQIPLRAD